MRAALEPGGFPLDCKPLGTPNTPPSPTTSFFFEIQRMREEGFSQGSRGNPDLSIPTKKTRTEADFKANNVSCTPRSQPFSTRETNQQTRTDLLPHPHLRQLPSPTKLGLWFPSHVPAPEWSWPRSECSHKVRKGDDERSMSWALKPDSPGLQLWFYGLPAP